MLVQTIELWDDQKHVTLTGYIPDVVNKKKTYPGIVICPGGAYLYTSEREAEPIALRFAALGYRTFVLHYNTYYGKGPINMHNPPPANTLVRYPQPLKDLAKAVATVREQAKELLINPDQIAVAGFSAGGHLAANLGVLWHTPFMEELMNMPKEEFRPNALILGYALLDNELSHELMSEAEREKFKDMFNLMNLALFGKKEIDLEQMRSFSPALHVSELTPPAFLWHTSEDDLVLSANSLQFAMNLVKHRIAYELHVFEKGGHGLALGDSTTALVNEHFNAAASQWVDLANRWLQQQFS